MIISRAEYGTRPASPANGPSTLLVYVRPCERLIHLSFSESDLLEVFRRFGPVNQVKTFIYPATSSERADTNRPSLPFGIIDFAHPACSRAAAQTLHGVNVTYLGSLEILPLNLASPSSGSSSGGGPVIDPAAYQLAAAVYHQVYPSDCSGEVTTAAVAPGGPVLLTGSNNPRGPFSSQQQQQYPRPACTDSGGAAAPCSQYMACIELLFSLFDEIVNLIVGISDVNLKYICKESGVMISMRGYPRNDCEDRLHIRINSDQYHSFIISLHMIIDLLKWVEGAAAPPPTAAATATGGTGFNIHLYVGGNEEGGYRYLGKRYYRPGGPE